MLELGQPMHAFDIDTIDERKIIVRNAKEGEKITTLDDQERELDPSMLVISDCNKAVAIAGVMGGQTQRLVLMLMQFYLNQQISRAQVLELQLKKLV